MAGRKKPVAKPAAAASATICPALVANGSAQKTPKRTRSAATASHRRESRSTSGPKSRPMAIIGRKSAIRSALTHGPEWVRSKTSTVSATNASHVPRPEPKVARKSSPKLGERWKSSSCRRTGGRTDAPTLPPSADGFDPLAQPGESLREEGVLLRRPDCDADSARCAELHGLPHDEPA